ncbi:unnamed protein product [Phytomonas sp. EM1]|nr:unnamed protein product [Phytomonas sp. EM1]|eukprot:CCW65203.1 unnamed protein product [Phytomonas sp. isolate EM1]
MGPSSPSAREDLRGEAPPPPLSSLDDAKPAAYDERLRVNLASIDTGSGKDGEPAAVAPVSRRGWGRLAQAYATVVPPGGLAASCLNLVSAILGAGVVAIPAAFKLSGVVMALLHLALVAVATVFAMRLLARVMLRTGARSYAETAARLLGPSAAHLVAVLIILLCFGGSVSYVIAVQTLMRPILTRPGSPTWLASHAGNRTMTALLWLLFMVPLTIPKRINSLRYVSLLGVMVIVYFVGVMVVHAATHGLRDPTIREEIAFVRTGNAALEGLGVFLFAFLCQINAFEVFHETAAPTVSNFTLYSALSVGFCTILYVFAGVFGYLDFGSGVTGSVLELYDPVHDPSVAVAYVGLVIKICIGFVLHMIPFRNAIYHFLRLDPMVVSYPKHILIVMCPSTLALLCGLFFPKINTVMGLSGSLCGGILGMVLPALYFMYSGKFTRGSVGLASFVGTYLLLIGGCAAVSFGTVTTVYSTIQNSFD